MVPVTVLRTARLSGSLGGSGTIDTSPVVVGVSGVDDGAEAGGVEECAAACTWLFAIEAATGGEAGDRGLGASLDRGVQQA